jgi:ferrous iron transport protein B
VIALLGNPNCGKTTIFNALTGLHQKVGNYPGVTVDKRSGRCDLGESSVEVVDLPGTYSLVATSPDEQVVADLLRGGRGGRAPDVLVAVVDASNLARNLYLVSQLLDLGRPLVIALNMTDVAERRGQPVDAAKLARALGCTVVPIVGHRRAGVDDLRLAIAAAVAHPAPSYPVPAPMLEREQRLARVIAQVLGREPEVGQNFARRLLIEDPAPELSALLGQEAIRAELRKVQAELRGMGIEPMQADIEARYQWIDGIVARVGLASIAHDRNRTEVVDSILVHKVWGLMLFAVIMASLFVGVFWVAKPMTNGVQAALGWLAETVTARVPDGAFHDLVRDGIFGGVGAVLGFVPQVAVLFFLLAALEDSGYLARAAFLMDRLLARVGLHGKSFVPLLSCFACAIPGILSARTIENRRERLTTIFVAPFMSCSARLPVYTLLIAACFAGLGAVAQGFTMLALYLLGIIAAALTALLIRRRLQSGRSSPFILEMPSYKVPQLSQVAWQSWTHTRSFVARAGTTIFVMSVVLWALFYYPRLPAERAAQIPEPARAAAQVEYSLAGRFGHAIEPMVRPLGYDWRMAVGLVSAFAAREVFVSTLGITYSVADAGKQAESLSSAMQADRRPDGSPVWTAATGVSLLIWFVLAMQCLSTLVVVRRETGGWRWPVAQVLFMNGLAYGLAMGCHSALTLLSG